MKIDEKAIRQLAGLLDETGLTEIEVAEGEQMIRVNKGGAMMAAPQAMSFAPMSADPAAPGQASTGTAAAPASADHPGAVTSPMVGTVYMQAEPGAPPFVQKGASVSEGDTICIIEAMKVMNPIKAPKSGTVVELAIENGQPVEYGDVLAIVE